MGQMTQQKLTDTTPLPPDRAAVRRKQAREIGFKSLPASDSGKRQRFLLVLRESANISRAARAAGIATGTAYGWRKKMPLFRTAWDEAMNEALDNLEEVLRDRAINGVERPHFHGGQITGHYRTYSDNLGMSILRARRPGIFGNEASGEGDRQDQAALTVTEALDKLAVKVVGRDVAAVQTGALNDDAAPEAGA